MNGKQASQTVLITGGSGGIGLALAKAFAARGARLLLVSKTPAGLERARTELLTTSPQTPVETLALDLSRDDAADSIHRWTEQNGWAVDILVNNAGFGSWGYADQIAEESDLLMFRLNMITPYLLMRRYLPAMRERNAGAIINMSSIAGIWNLPGFVSYGATKAFLRFYSLSLGMELALEGSAVRVMAICPSSVKSTNFQAKAGMNHTDMFDNMFTTTPEEVARDTLRALDRGLPLVVSGRVMRGAAPLLSSIPRRLFSLVAKPNLSRTP